MHHNNWQIVAKGNKKIREEKFANAITGVAGAINNGKRKFSRITLKPKPKSNHIKFESSDEGDSSDEDDSSDEEVRV